MIFWMLTGKKKKFHIFLNVFCRQTFDLIDMDGSGTLEKSELDDWFKMCGAELDLTKLLNVLVGEGELTRDKFAKLMSSSAKSHRREYDIGDDGSTDNPH